MNIINGSHYNPDQYRTDQFKKQFMKIEDNVKNKKLDTGQNQGEKDKALYDACKNFEAIFTQLVFKEMRKSVEKSDLVNGGFGEEVFEGMLDEEIAQSSAESNGSLANLLYQQLRLQLKD
ncbi:MAG: rod-binding protein [Halanaerobiales bacterium]|nr:rod-binding protein [Halanaerobiales bacterium]